MLILLMFWCSCSNGSAADPADADTVTPPAQDYVGTYVAVAVEPIPNDCGFDMTDDELPHVGDGFVASVDPEDPSRLITDECETPGDTNCIDHFPDWWDVLDGSVENKHVDDLYEGNLEVLVENCKLIANSTWTATLDGTAWAITLRIVLAPEGDGCGQTETDMDGCMPGLDIHMERR